MDIVPNYYLPLYNNAFRTEVLNKFLKTFATMLFLRMSIALVTCNNVLQCSIGKDKPDEG